MKLIGLMPVRNEDWCLGLSLRVALMWCDEVVVLLHACTDRSKAICEEIDDELWANGGPRRITVIEVPGETWNEMAHRQETLECARLTNEQGLDGATHIAMIDADEILTGNLIEQAPYLARATGPISQYAEPVPPAILQLPGYNLRGSLDRYHQNGIWGNRWFSTAFQDDPRLGWAGDRFHAREPQGMTLQPYRPIHQGQGGTLHLWGCSERRQRAHHAWYKLTERLRWPDKPTRVIDQTYSLWRSPADSAAMYPLSRSWADPWTFSDVPEAWWAPYAHLMHYLDLNAVPWQEAESRRLYAEHGPEMFAGLDLFGVCG